MIAVGIVALSLGAVLTQRFKALAIAPICLAALGCSIWFGTTLHQGALAGLVALVAIQVGYLVGLAIESLVGLKADPKSSASITGAGANPTRTLPSRF
jgi:hypothetical protein